MNLTNVAREEIISAEILEMEYKVNIRFLEVHGSVLLNGFFFLMNIFEDEVVKIPGFVNEVDSGSKPGHCHAYLSLMPAF